MSAPANGCTGELAIHAGLGRMRRAVTLPTGTRQTLRVHLSARQARHARRLIAENRFNPRSSATVQDGRAYRSEDV